MISVMSHLKMTFQSENNITVGEGWNANIVLIYRITSRTRLELWAGQMSAGHI